VAGSCEYGDEPSGSGATELAYRTRLPRKYPLTLTCNPHVHNCSNVLASSQLPAGVPVHFEQIYQ
jgi:hypothetical protein